ncbi:hypothetical protein KEM52_003245 [Ascosphaera acerosa]|nr:hypothetical protein KEM52_003245 [Ascosphaera acerosa]
MKLLSIAGLTGLAATAAASSLASFDQLSERSLLFEEPLTQRDLAKRLDPAKFAQNCFGLELSRFTDLLQGGSLFGLLIPLLSTPCFPTAMTLAQCSVEGGIDALFRGNLLQLPNLDRAKKCLCQNADFVGQLDRCYTCARNNGGQLLPDLSLLPGVDEAALGFCSASTSTSRRSATDSNAPDSSEEPEKETVTAAPTASNVVIQSSGPSSVAGDPDSEPSSAPDEKSAAQPTYFVSLHALGSTLAMVSLLSLVVL